MKLPINTSLIGVVLAVCDAMRHMGTNTITNDTSAKINGSTVEMVPDLVQEARKLEKVEAQHPFQVLGIHYLEPVCPNWYPSLSTKGQGRNKSERRPARNTAPLKHLNNPPRFRRG